MKKQNKHVGIYLSAEAMGVLLAEPPSTYIKLSKQREKLFHLVKAMEDEIKFKLRKGPPKFKVLNDTIVMP